MTDRDKLILLAANSAARVLVYAPLMVLAFMFMPVALPALALSASQPYLGNGAAVLGQWLDHKFPRAMRPVNWALDHWEKSIGSKWWLHTTVIVGLIASATIPAPKLLGALFSKATSLPGFVGKVGGWMGGVIGGAGGVWGQLLPLAFLTALPMAMKLSTTGFDKAFLWLGDHIPKLRGLDMDGVLSRRDASRLDRQLQREERWLEKYGLPPATPPAPTPTPSPEPAPPTPDLPPLPDVPGAPEVAVALAGLGLPKVTSSLTRVAVAGVRQIVVPHQEVPPVAPPELLITRVAVASAAKVIQPRTAAVPELVVVGRVVPRKTTAAVTPPAAAPADRVLA